MRKLPWGLSLRADRSAVLTTLGVALVVGFASFCLVVPQALAIHSVSPNGPFAKQDAMIARPGLEPFEPAALHISPSTSVLLASAKLANGTDVTLVAFEGARPGNVTNGTARAGPSTPVGKGPLRFASGTTFPLGAVLVDDARVGPDWVLVSPSALRALAPTLAGGKATYVLAPGLAASDASRLESEGFVVDPVPGVEPFFRASATEIAADLLLTVLFGCILVGLLASEFLRGEIRDRRREIGLWRAVGMDARNVIALLLARAGAIAGAGIVLGILAAQAVAAVGAGRGGASVLGYSLPLGEVFLLGVAFFLASLVGGFAPARRASRAEIRDTMEAVA